jgi:hypothetical protein
VDMNRVRDEIADGLFNRRWDLCNVMWTIFISCGQF